MKPTISNLKPTISSFYLKVKTWGGFNLTILKVNKSTMIEWKITLDLKPKSKATSSKTN